MLINAKLQHPLPSPPAWGGEFEPKELKEKLRHLKVKSSISQVSGSEEKVSKVYNQGTKLLTH